MLLKDEILVKPPILYKHCCLTVETNKRVGIWILIWSLARFYAFHRASVKILHKSLERYFLIRH